MRRVLLNLLNQHTAFGPSKLELSPQRGLKPVRQEPLGLVCGVSRIATVRRCSLAILLAQLYLVRIE